MKNRRVPLCEGGQFIVSSHRFCGGCWNELFKRYGSVPLPTLQVGELLPASSGSNGAVVEVGKLLNGKLLLSAMDWGRLNFLKGLQPVREIVPFRRDGREYSGFVFRTDSGRQIALVDSAFVGNALYAFDVDEQGDWIKVAQMTRLEARRHGHPFICRFFHHGDWQGRVLKLFV